MFHFLRQLLGVFRRRGILLVLRKAWLVATREGLAGVLQRFLLLSARAVPEHAWIRLFQNVDDDFRAKAAASIKAWPRHPLISVIMPVHDTPELWLRAALDSVLDQIYPNWELCVADDASSQPHVARVLQEYQARDARIKLVTRDTNGHIAAASNSALALVSGEFVVLFDHDDLLEPHALFRVAESILVDRPDMLYSDEALIEAQSGAVIGHAFRPAFSPELLRSHAYIIHLAAFRADLLRDIGGFDETLKISQDYDLVLRAAERAHVIVHIPEVLYRWRTHADSTGHRKQGEVMETSKMVLAKHLQRCGVDALVTDGKKFNFFELRYPLAAEQRVAIIIPTKNHGALVRQCVSSIEQTVDAVAYDIVIVDHASDDAESLAIFGALAERHKVLRYTGPFNFSAINNWAVRQLTSTYSHYLFCNNDIEATHPGWLGRMLELGQHPDVGIVGAKLYYPDGITLQHAGVCVGMFRMAEHYGKFMNRDLEDGLGMHPGYLGSLVANREMSAVTAACMLMRSDAFAWVGGFDEHIAVGFGDVDLCLRARQAGYRVLFCPHAELIHHESYSRGKCETQIDPHPLDSAYFLKRWQGYIDSGDPYYNPNLTLYNTYWHLKGAEELKGEVGKQEGRRVYRKHPGFPEVF